MIESGDVEIARCDNPDVPRIAAGRQERCRQREPENGMLVLNEREANKRLSDFIGPVVRRRDLFKLDSPVKLGTTYHGVAKRYPHGFLRCKLAERRIHRDFGIGMNNRRTSGRNAELAQENANTEHALDRKDRLMELDDARRLSRVGRSRAGCKERATSRESTARSAP